MRIDHSAQTMVKTLKGIACEVVFVLLYLGFFATCLGAVILVPR